MPKAGLAGKKLETMKKLIRGGETLESICQWLDVFPEFVAPFMADYRQKSKIVEEPIKIKVPEETVSPEEPAPLEEPQDDDPYAVKNLDNVDLKEFRKWIQDNLYADLPNNSTRKTCIREYMTRT